MTDDPLGGCLTVVGVTLGCLLLIGLLVVGAVALFFWWSYNCCGVNIQP